MTTLPSPVTGQDTPAPRQIVDVLFRKDTTSSPPVAAAGSFWSAWASVGPVPDGEMWIVDDVSIIAQLAYAQPLFRAVVLVDTQRFDDGSGFNGLSFPVSYRIVDTIASCQLDQITPSPTFATAPDPLPTYDGSNFIYWNVRRSIVLGPRKNLHVGCFGMKIGPSTIAATSTTYRRLQTTADFGR